MFTEIIAYIILITNNPIIFVTLVAQMLFYGYCKLTLHNSKNWRIVNGAYEYIGWQ